MRLKRLVSAPEGNTIGSPVTYGSSVRAAVGRQMVGMAAFVIAGLDPAIHLAVCAVDVVDPRVKPRG